MRAATVRATCHGSSSDAGAGSDAPVVALVGAPNVGKSTLFNALTGARVTVGNWPGTTVAVSRGTWRAGRELTLIDFPGAYSLDPLSPDEALSRDLVVDAPHCERPEVTVAVVDASQLARGLYLVTQLREHDLRVVVALTMGDVATSRGITVDPALLAQELGAPVVAVDPRRQRGLDELARVVVDSAARDVPSPRLLAPHPSAPHPLSPHQFREGPTASQGVEDDALAREDERFATIDRAVTASITRDPSAARTLSDRVDRWVTAPVAGPLIFMGVMWLVFQVTTTVAAPLQAALGSVVSGPLTSTLRSAFGSVGLGGSWAEGLVVDGLVAGVGMVLTFAPLMALMFVLLALLEDSGYLARAAVVTDRLMRSIGLPGRAFLPLVVGFGCNVPAISATRILPTARERLLTSLLIPFTSCSARLTVYTLVTSVFFGPWAGTVVFVMYLVSIGFVIGVGALLRTTLWRTFGADPLLMDLPAFHRPTLRLIAAVAWQRLSGFLRTASGIIVAAVTVVWLLQSIPAVGGVGFGEAPVADSVYGRLAQAVAPIFGPAGFATWQTVSALVVGFVAKEAVISSWAQTYAVADPASGAAGALGDQIVHAFNASSGGHPLPAVLAFLVFLLAYTPCVATLAAQRREIGVRWTAFGVGLQLVVAWIAAVVVFQVGRWWW
ncbi:ferrous iron transport protein B [Aestuariimicrobium sp. T2.26MG-19.2B]|uniref:ferrous iron transport protein B n=1 Tax=Aestuariimicrobium sp. T2.26MG-19.2B TaxID=3040679 RepID=UPI002477BB25|nr:ferrous iron transport protein B [Aestuariimicrobium sp. T2.26MG-19.2B]CAI9407566.1 Fe(2+) transporter FeoB [Aestuariimicrobium sp. T2.26MG-19.2B]